MPAIRFKPGDVRMWVDGREVDASGSPWTLQWGPEQPPRKAPLKRRRRLLGRLRGRALLAFAAYRTGRGPWPGAARLGL